jgi:glycosyltransferase involved in cell wall biosynthesis
MMNTDTERKEESTAGAERLRIAAYGFVLRDAGSVASAGSELCAALLRLGCSIDFYVAAGFVDPVELKEHSGYTYRPISVFGVPAIWKFIETCVPKKMQRMTIWLYSQVSQYLHNRAIAKAIRKRHAESPYDILLVIGLLPPFRIEGLACAAWPQGPPNGEADALRSSRERLIRYSGRLTYALLMYLYWWKRIEARRFMRNADAILCGSKWTAGAWERLGASRSIVYPVAYPFDVDAFQSSRSTAGEGGDSEFDVPGEGPLILWLGRIVPRKRIDLALEGFKRLRQSGRKARLLVIGRISYARGYRKLISEYQNLEGFSYREAIPHHSVPALLRKTGAILQPSENEDIGSTVIEGLASGVPAILGATNGTKDYVGETSVVFPSYDPDAVCSALCETLDRLSRDDGSIADECVAQARRAFDTESVARRVLEIARETIERTAIGRNSKNKT